MISDDEVSEAELRAIIASDPIRAIRLVYMSFGFDNKVLVNREPYALTWCVMTKDHNVVFNC